MEIQGLNPTPLLLFLYEDQLVDAVCQYCTFYGVEGDKINKRKERRTHIEGSSVIHYKKNDNILFLCYYPANLKYIYFYGYIMF